MVIFAVIFLKGLPNVQESSYHVDIFLIAHPILSCSYVMAIYLTVLVTLERFYAICSNGMAKKQDDQSRIKLIMVFIFGLVAIFNVPKCFEYTLKSNYVRTNYDLDEQIWTGMSEVNNTIFFLEDRPVEESKNITYHRSLLGSTISHLEFLQQNIDQVESGAANRKLAFKSIHIHTILCPSGVLTHSSKCNSDFVLLHKVQLF